VNECRPSPIDLGGLDVVSIAAGDTNAVLLTRNGEVYTWGRGQSFALGHGDEANCNSPRVVDVGEKVTAVACSGTHCAVVTPQGVKTWGQGALGRANDSDALPGQVSGLNDVAIKSVACGRSHTLAVSTEGRLYAWGKGYEGALGLGGKEDRSLPERGPDHLRIVQAAAGNGFSLLLSDKGELYSCGSGEFGQTGHGGTTDRYLRIPSPIRSLLSKRVTYVAAGPFHAACCTEDGEVYTWGLGLDGQIGIGSSAMHNPTPQRVHLPVQGKVCQVSCGSAHTAAVTQAGELFIWGRGRDGQLGQSGVISPAARRDRPVVVDLPGRVTHVSLGGDFSLALVR